MSRKRIYITVSGNTIQTLNHLSEEHNSISKSVDFLAEYYRKHGSAERQEDAVAEKAADIVMERLRSKAA
jgi:hypothetical protein